MEGRSLPPSVENPNEHSYQDNNRLPLAARRFSETQQAGSYTGQPAGAQRAHTEKDCVFRWQRKVAAGTAAPVFPSLEAEVIPEHWVATHKVMVTKSLGNGGHKGRRKVRVSWWHFGANAELGSLYFTVHSGEINAFLA